MSGRKCAVDRNRTGWLPKDLKSVAGSMGLIDALFEGNPDMLFITDGDGVIIGANSRAMAEFGYGRSELENQPIHFLLPEGARQRHAAHLKEYLQHPSARAMGSGMDLKACDARGNEFPVDILLWPFSTEGKKYVMGVCHRLDVSLARSQMQLHALVESTHDAAVNLFDSDGRILTWNDGAKRIYNLSASEALGQDFSVLFSPDEIAAGEPKRELQEAARSSQPVRTSGWRTGADGQNLWVEGEFRSTMEVSGHLSGFTRVLRDMTPRKQAEEQLREVNRALAASEQMFRLLVESVTDYAVYMLDPQGRVVTWNAGAEHRKGYSKREVLGRHFAMFFTPEAAEAGQPEQELALAAKDGRFETQDWRARKDGTRFWAHVVLTAIRGTEGELLGFAKVTRDMSAQKALEDAQAKLALDLEQRVKDRTMELEASVAELQTKNEEIEALVAMVSHDLGEKEVLLREVYHRVKNNLQVVQSLLKMGARTFRSSEARQSIETAVQRVHVMAMVHEHLYQAPDLSGLTMSNYLRDVVEGAIASNCAQPNQIELQFDVEAIAVPLDFAIPLGLLANELVSNCLKHGLPNGRAGRISISAHSIPGAVRFIVHDNGAGLPDDFDAKNSSTMGVKLAASLAHQLGGNLEFTSEHGCKIQADLSRLCRKDDKPQPVLSGARVVSTSLLADNARKAEIPERLSRALTEQSHLLS